MPITVYEEEKRREAAKITGEENGLTWFTPPANSYPNQILGSILASSKNALAHSELPADPLLDRSETSKTVITTHKPPVQPSKPAERRIGSIGITSIVVNAPTMGQSRSDIAVSVPIAPKPAPPKQPPPAPTVAPSSRSVVNTGDDFENTSHQTTATGTANGSSTPAPKEQPPITAAPVRPAINDNRTNSQNKAFVQSMERAVNPEGNPTADKQGAAAPRLTAKQRRIMKRNARHLATLESSRSAGSEALVSVATDVTTITISPSKAVSVSASVPAPAPAPAPSEEDQQDPALDIQAGFQFGSVRTKPIY